MKKYLVETISIFRIRYVIEAKDPSHAMDEVVCAENLKEFSQQHLDETTNHVTELDDEEYIELFDNDNDYLRNWTDAQKRTLINVIDYEEEHTGNRI